MKSYLAGFGNLMKFLGNVIHNYLPNKYDS